MYLIIISKAMGSLHYPLPEYRYVYKTPSIVANYTTTTFNSTTKFKQLNEEAGYKSAQNWPNFSRFPRAGEPSMEAGPKGKK